MSEVVRLAQLAARGEVAKRMDMEAQGLMHRWHGEGIPLRLLRERVETLQNDVDEGLIAAEDYIAEAETDAQRRAARAQYDALSAIRGVVVRELEEMRLRS